MPARATPPECTLGVDVGTSATKGVLVDADGRVLGTEVRYHRIERPHAGWAEIDGELWWDEFTSITRALLERTPARITAVGVSGMGPCVLLADADDIPVRPAILYGVDSRASAQIDALDIELGSGEIVRRTGSRLSSQAAGPKIAWVREREPEAYLRAQRLFMPASWFVRRLTGEYVLDRHSASQCAPLYDLETHDWYAPWALQVAPGILLPRLGWAGEIAGHVTPPAAAITGIPVGTPVIFGTIDAWMEAASVGADRPGDLMLMYGTTMFLIASSTQRLSHPAMWTTEGVTADTTSLAGGMAASGAIVEWFRELVGGPGHDDLLRDAARSGPGARGLLLLPYFAGERTPLFDPDARGVLAGLTLSHTRGDVARAILDATALGVRHNVEALRDAGARIDDVVAVGGGARGLWPQVVSDATGLRQQIPAITTGAAYGGAYLAAAATGMSESIRGWNPVRRIVEPDPAAAEDYDELFRLYRELYDATLGVTHRLASWRGAA